MDDVIRDLAKNHGREDLSDTDVREVKSHLANAFVDDVLDGKVKEETPLPAPEQTTESQSTE